MFKINLKRFLLIFAISLLFILSTSAVSLGGDITTTQLKEADTFSMKFIDAYYTALEDDGVENDIVEKIEVYIDADVTSTKSRVVFFDLYITLPSGLKYEYSFNLITKRNKLLLILYFHNHATESGIYESGIFAWRQGDNVDYMIHQIEFDPPGGSPGDPVGLTYEIA